mmetsp:Transcript_86728/g.280803  ORF Transcript_86728/g.280803 Transcript_86728/m.280803 type:complete len:208 (-) Transcript_86728:586-1209(-)
MPQALPREVPEDRAGLADLVHEAHADSLLRVVKCEDLHAAELQAPRGRLSEQRQHTRGVAENHHWCARGHGRGQSLQVLKGISTCKRRLWVGRKALESHLAADAFEALQARRVHIRADAEVLPEVLRSAGREHHHADARDLWAHRAQEPQDQGGGLAAVWRSLDRDKVLALIPHRLHDKRHHTALCLQRLLPPPAAEAALQLVSAGG